MTKSHSLLESDVFHCLCYIYLDSTGNMFYNGVVLELLLSNEYCAELQNKDGEMSSFFYYIEKDIY